MKTYYVTPLGIYAEILIKHKARILLTFAAKNEVEKFIRTYPNTKIFLDSGAFTAYTQNKNINIDEYIDFIKDNKKHFYTYANLDVIGNQVASNDNLKYIKSKGLNPLPIFTYGAEEKYLLEILAENDYIALGGLVPYTRRKKKLQDWLDYCFSIIGTKTKVHGLGLTSYWAWERYPFYSVDSSSWMQAGRFATIKINKKSHNKQTKSLLGYKLNTSHYGLNCELALLDYENSAKNITKLWESRGIKWD